MGANRIHLMQQRSAAMAEYNRALTFLRDIDRRGRVEGFVPVRYNTVTLEAVCGVLVDDVDRCTRTPGHSLGEHASDETVSLAVLP